MVEKKDKTDIIEFLKLWVSVIAGGLTSLYISQKYGLQKDFLSNISLNNILDISLQSLMFIILIVISFGIVYFGFHLFINFLVISCNFVFGPWLYLLELLRMYGYISKKEESEEEIEKGFLDENYYPKKYLYNLIIAVILIFYLYKYKLAYLINNLGELHSLFLFLILIIYSIFYSLLIIFEKNHNS